MSNNLIGKTVIVYSPGHRLEWHTPGDVAVVVSEKREGVYILSTSYDNHGIQQDMFILPEETGLRAVRVKLVSTNDA